MASRISAATEESGVRATFLLLCFYAHATFGGAPPRPEQRRFICDLGSFARLLEEAKRKYILASWRAPRRRAA